MSSNVFNVYAIMYMFYFGNFVELFNHDFAASAKLSFAFDQFR